MLLSSMYMQTKFLKKSHIYASQLLMHPTPETFSAEDNEKSANLAKQRMCER